MRGYGEITTNRARNSYVQNYPQRVMLSFDSIEQEVKMDLE
jgi:hypothetical protein